MQTDAFRSSSQSRRASLLSVTPLARSVSLQTLGPFTYDKYSPKNYLLLTQSHVLRPHRKCIKGQSSSLCPPSVLICFCQLHLTLFISSIPATLSLPATMFARVFAVASLAALAVANPLAVRGGESKCNNGQIQCCQQTQQVTYSLATRFDRLLILL